MANQINFDFGMDFDDPPHVVAITTLNVYEAVTINLPPGGGGGGVVHGEHIVINLYGEVNVQGGPGGGGGGGGVVVHGEHQGGFGGLDPDLVAAAALNLQADPQAQGPPQHNQAQGPPQDQAPTTITLEPQGFVYSVASEHITPYIVNHSRFCKLTETMVMYLLRHSDLAITNEFQANSPNHGLFRYPVDWFRSRKDGNDYANLGHSYTSLPKSKYLRYCVSRATTPDPTVNIVRRRYKLIHGNHHTCLYHYLLEPANVGDSATLYPLLQ